MTTPTPTPTPDDIDALLRAVPADRRDAALDAIRALVPPAPANDPTEPTDPTARELAPDAAQHVAAALRLAINLETNLDEFRRFLTLVIMAADALAEHEPDAALSLSDAAGRLLPPARQTCEDANTIYTSLRAAFGFDAPAKATPEAA